MKNVILSIGAGVLMTIAGTGAASTPTNAGATGSGFDQFLRQFEEGIRRFVNGDAKLWKQHASRQDDVTIMGAWGSYEKGWGEVEARYDWAASRFRQSSASPQFEYLAAGVSGDLAYTVAIERSEARVVGAERVAPMFLRVTHIFRKEDGTWKLVHRHADPLMDKTAPPAVLKK
jgi:ketosteroid isomerase-like protein